MCCGKFVGVERDGAVRGGKERTVLEKVLEWLVPRCRSEKKLTNRTAMLGQPQYERMLRPPLKYTAGHHQRDDRPITGHQTGDDFAMCAMPVVQRCRE